VCLPARRDRVIHCGPDEQVSLGLGAGCVHHGPFGKITGLGGRAGQYAVASEQVIDLAGHLHPPP
jgi:hypothetical protein